MKLKKKHRPMRLDEWAGSIGAQVIVAGMDEDTKQSVAAKAGEDTQEAFEAISSAYHAYICAHIAYVLEKKP